jgi:hypothetical protein
MNKANMMVMAAALFVTANAGYARTIDHPYDIGAWPGWRSGAVSFTFDDNCSNQLALAVPMFDGFGFKLTLFTIIHGMPGWSDPNWIGLQEAALKGHEVASHTVTHPYLNTLTLDQQRAELKNSQDDINAHVMGQKCVTMAYPYCVTGDMALCTQYYMAARGCQGFVEAGTPGDIMNISSIICGNQGSVQTAAGLNADCDMAASKSGWCVFLIHGIDNDGGYSPLPSAELRACLQYLDTKRSTIWVSTFANVARYVRERDSMSVLETSNQDTRITLHATVPLDPAIFNYPVSVRRPLPAGWPSARVTQNGQVLAIAQMTTARSAKAVLFDVVPDGNEVVLTKAPNPPAGLTAAAGAASVALTWTSNTESNLAGYNVYRSTSSGKNYSKLNASLVGGSSYTDPNAAHGTSYYYVVTAVDADSFESGYSNEAAVTIPAGAPSATIAQTRSGTNAKR